MATGSIDGADPQRPMAPTHRVRATGEACRVESWPVGRLVSALGRMGLLEGDGEVALENGLRKLAALRHPCLLGLCDPEAYLPDEGEGGEQQPPGAQRGQQLEQQQQQQQSSYIRIVVETPGDADRACLWGGAGEAGWVARQLLAREHDEDLESVCRALVLHLARGLAHLHAHGAAHGRVALESVVLGPAKHPWQARLRLLPPARPSADGEGWSGPREGEGAGKATPEEDVYALGRLIGQLLAAVGQPFPASDARDDLVHRITSANPAARPSMEEVLAHPWLASAASLPAADYYEMDLPTGQEVAILRFRLPGSPAAYLELSAVALRPEDSASPLGLAREDARDVVLVLPSPPAPLRPGAAEEECKVGGVGLEGLRQLVAAVAAPAATQAAPERESKQQQQQQQQPAAVPPRGVWVTPPPVPASVAAGSADGAWRLHKSLLAAAASLLPSAKGSEDCTAPTSSSTVLALPLALYTAHCPRLLGRPLAHEVAAFASLLAAAAPASPSAGGGGVRRLLLVAGDAAELKEVLHAFHSLAAATTATVTASSPLSGHCLWAPPMQRLAGAITALVDTGALPFLPTGPEEAEDRREELRAYARNLAPRAGEEGSRATALQCCLWAGTLGRRAIRLVMARPDVYRVTEVWGGGVGAGGANVQGARVLAVVNDVRVDPWVEALMRGHAKAVGGGGRWARLLTPLDALESLAALHGLLRVFTAPVHPPALQEEAEAEVEAEAAATTAAPTTIGSSGGGIYHGWGLGEEDDESEAAAEDGYGRAWGAMAAEGGDVRRLSVLAGAVADPSLDVSVETVVERFPRCWLEEQPAVAGAGGPRAREAPF